MASYKDAEFNEVMDQIIGLFYNPLRKDRQYCCEPEQIITIKRFIDGLEQCGGNRIQMKTDVFSEKEKSECTNPDELMRALQHPRVNVLLSTRAMYMAAILCHYISSRISGGYSFDVKKALSRLIRGMDAKSMFERAAIADFMLTILFNKESSDHPCLPIIDEFKRDLLSLKEFSAEKVEEWSGIDVTSPEFQAKMKKIKDAQDTLLLDWLARSTSGELGGGKIKKTKRNKKRKTKKY